MDTRELPHEQWHSYFDTFTKRETGMLVTVELMSEDLGDQIEVERLPLQALSYDPRDDVLEVAVGGRGIKYPVVFRHLISAPRSVELQEQEAEHPVSIEVTDGEGIQTLIRLFEPPELEP